MVPGSVAKLTRISLHNTKTGDTQHISLTLVDINEHEMPQDMIPMRDFVVCLSPSKPFQANSSLHVMIGNICILFF